MTNYELAINEDGEPFSVPPEVAGWRVRRSLDGRGRPSLVHARGKGIGKPLILPVDASHTDVLAAAGPGRYRLEAVDAEQHRIDGIPVACTGPLTADGTPDDGAELNDAPAGSRPNLESLVGQVVSANARMVEKALEQMGTVMTGVATLLHAAHNAGITSRPPPPPPPPPPVQDDDDSNDDDEDEDGSEDPSAGVAASGLSEMVQFIIKEAIAKAVPLVIEKLATSGGSIGGLPLEAILDWRKAVPTPATTAPEAPNAVNVPPAPSTVPPVTTNATDLPTAAAVPTHAGAAPSGEPPPGAVPADMAAAPTAPAASSPRSTEDAAALLNAHIMQVWQGLSPPERERAGRLIAQLHSDARAALLAELARLSIPEAIARARSVIEAQPPS